MKASRIKKATLRGQRKKIKDKIAFAKHEGQSECEIRFPNVYPELIEELLSDEFNVGIVYYNKSSDITLLINWLSAKKGIRGQLKFYDAIREHTAFPLYKYVERKAM